MYRKEFIVLSAIVLLIFTLVAATSLLMERALQSEAQMLAEDTLPGLVNAGEATSRVNDNWQNICLLVELPTSAARSNLIARIRANTTEDFWQQYQKSIFEPRDKILFAQMRDARSQYLALVRQYFELINQQKLEAAGQFLDAQVKPAFLQYKSSATNLFQLNADIGKQRAYRIIKLSRWLPWVAGLFCAAIFSFGVVVGLKGAFGSLAFASRLREHPNDKVRRTVLTNWR